MMDKSLKASFAAKLGEDSGQNGIEEFQILSSRYADYGRAAGVEVVPFRDAKLPKFNLLGADNKRQVLEALRRCVSICATTAQAGYKMQNSQALIWHAIKEFKMRPPSDFFSYLESENDII